MKEKLEKAYGLLERALHSCGDWKEVAEQYEDAMEETMDIILDVIRENGNE